jgi:hypothetical protein
MSHSYEQIPRREPSRPVALLPLERLLVTAFIMSHLQDYRGLPEDQFVCHLHSIRDRSDAFLIKLYECLVRLTGESL